MDAKSESFSIGDVEDGKMPMVVQLLSEGIEGEDLVLPKETVIFPQNESDSVEIESL